MDLIELSEPLSKLISLETNKRVKDIKTIKPGN